jgi:hypothetical protein
MVTHITGRRTCLDRRRWHPKRSGNGRMQPPADRTKLANQRGSGWSQGRGPRGMRASKARLSSDAGITYGAAPTGVSGKPAGNTVVLVRRQEHSRETLGFGS